MIGVRGSGMVGDHAVISGFAAALIVRLVGSRWRGTLTDGRVVADDLAEVEQAMEALEAAAAGWRGAHLDTFSRESIGPQGKRHGKDELPRSEAMITSTEAAELLGVTRQRVGQLVAEGVLSSGSREGGHLLLPLRQVLALRKLREAA